MSYGICRIQKIGGRTDIAGIQIHNRRERGHSNSNPDIDFKLSKYNQVYEKERGKTYNEMTDNVIKKYFQGNKTIRKDAVRLCEVLFTSDKKFFDGLSQADIERYFSDCRKWAEKRYGAENIIATTVHYDEETPHMHIDFVPMTRDGRLSAKEVVGLRKDMQAMQDNFYKEIGKPWKLERGRRADLDNREDKPRRHKELKELKAETLKENKKLSEETEKLRENKKLLEIEVNDLKGKKEEEREELNKIKAKRAKITAESAEEVKRYRNTQEEVKVQIKELQSKIEEMKKEVRKYETTIRTNEEIDKIGRRKIIGGGLLLTKQEEEKLINQAKATQKETERANKAEERAEKAEDKVKDIIYEQEEMKQKLNFWYRNYEEKEKEQEKTKQILEKYKKGYNNLKELEKYCNKTKIKDSNTVIEMFKQTQEYNSNKYYDEDSKRR
jgi:hypothetical protein